MKLNQALHMLAKFFQLDEEIFSKYLGKEKIIAWAEQVKVGEIKGPDGKDIIPSKYRLTQEQHAFLIGEILTF
jgi:hypothetical protein